MTTPEWLTTDWLTDVLRRSGDLSDGRVGSFTIESPRSTIFSNVMRVRLDYRLSVVWQLAVPVWQSTMKLGAWIWWGHLERGMLAFEDLGCDELLG